MVDGMDLTTLRLRDYRSQLGVVLQDNFLFDGTIADNVAFSKPGATRTEILAAAGLAHCDEFVSRFTEGYDTVVGERGVKLSGGQRQRVAIARALAPGSRFIVADEPVSMLDVSIRVGVLNLLADLQRAEGLGVLYITHDLATARHFSDEILVMYQGHIVERGQADEVILNPQHEYTKRLREAAADPDRLGELRDEVRREMAGGAA
jgi:ABC-type multidrug transport system fused ATPase/permease subunit